jgi:hypothetical protein
MYLVYTVFDLHREGSTLDYPKGGMGEISQSISNVITSSGVSLMYMYVYMCIYICLCMCIHVYSYIYVNMDIYVYIYIHIYGGDLTEY